MARLGKGLRGRNSLVRYGTAPSGDLSCVALWRPCDGQSHHQRWCQCQSCCMRLLDQRGLRRGEGRTRWAREGSARAEYGTGQLQPGLPLATGRALRDLQAAAPSARALQLPALPWFGGGLQPRADLPLAVQGARTREVPSHIAPVKPSHCQCLILGNCCSGSRCLMGCSSVVGTLQHQQ